MLVHNINCLYESSGGKIDCICNFSEFGINLKKAKRISHPIRYDILDPDFLEDLAKIADFGAKKYGDFNWHLSKLTGNKGPINHIYKHLGSYRKNEPYDHEELGTQRSMNLVAIAFNAMMEYFWAKEEEEENKVIEPNDLR